MAKGVVCVSETTFNDICSILRPTTSKFTVIKEASKYQPTNPNWVESETPSDSRFLFVANVEKTKNVVCLLEALRLAQGRGLSIQVDWIGRDPNYLVENWLREKGNLANFFPRGYVEDDELRVAYRDSLALVVPSLREGFCLPVLEAHSFGTPVIGSDIPILREVVGGGGIFFDASDPEALLRALMVMSSDVDLRLALRQQAIANARLYSWDRSARELSQFATKCCDPGADGT